MDNQEVRPKELAAIVQSILKQRPGKWMSPKQLWEEVLKTEPQVAEQVRARVARYKDPARNNEVWFLSNTLYHVNKVPGFSLSDIEAEPAMKGESLWLIARAD